MDCRVAVCQLRPRLGALEPNFEAHHEWIERAAGADLVVFPELSLSGYFLRDHTPDVALRLDDPRVGRLVARSRERSLLFGLVEESDDHRFYNSAVFAEDGRILQVHRKVHLCDYGIFEEKRYFAAGERIETVVSRHGRFGVLICEDAWHLPTAWLHFLAGADALLIPSASPARGFDAPEEAELSSQAAWRALTCALGRFLQTWVVYANRTGFEDGALFWGASLLVSPFGHVAAEAPGGEEALLTGRLDADPLRRARIATPLRRDARPDLVRLHLARLLADPDAIRAAEEGGAGGR
jgi:predicted amidohydrolase